MVGIKTLSLLAAAGSVLAAPQGGFQFGGHNGGDNGVFTHTDYVYTTVMITVTAGQEPTTTYVPPPEPTTTVATTTTTTEAPAPPQTTTQAAAAPANQGSSSSGSGASDSGDWQSVVNTWRGVMGMGSISFDQTLVGNCEKTIADMPQGQLVHELNPGSNAQVLAGGDQNSFQECYVGGWLCEMPSLPGLGSSVCSSNGASTYGNNGGSNSETGHAEILSDTKYSKIGCAWGKDVWCCDLAF